MEAVKLFSYQAAYYPIPLPGTPASYPSFPALASFLIDAEAAVEDLTMAAYQQLETKYALNIPGDLPEWPAGIQCTDNGNILNGRPFLTLLPEIAIYETQSYVRTIHLFSLPLLIQSVDSLFIQAWSILLRAHLGKIANLFII